jgi:two-component system sensor histidine kinase CpxA
MEVPGELVVRADAELLTRALSNLLRNAVRYAGECGPITVCAQREQDKVKITVADRGPGVPANDLPRLFDPFYRADASRDRETGGVGLGLAIVKTCIESCGGAVACRNLEPAGLEVTIRLQGEKPD